MLDMRELSSGLKLGDDGIWYSSGGESVSYPADGNDGCFAVEDCSFWFRHRNDCITSIVGSFPPEHGGTIFDVGGGNGFVALALENAGFDVVLMEPGAAGARNAVKRGLKNVVCSTIAAAGLSPRSVPAIGLFDVLEHIQDDLGFLRILRSLLTDGGRLYMTVPAYPFLWSTADTLAGHFRRYDLRGIHGLLTAAGLGMLFSSYFFRLMPLPIFCLRTVPYWLRWRGSGHRAEAMSREHASGGLVRRTIMASLFRGEVRRLAGRRPIRFGSSCLVVATAS